MMNNDDEQKKREQQKTYFISFVQHVPLTPYYKIGLGNKTLIGRQFVIEFGRELQPYHFFLTTLTLVVTLNISFL